LGAGQWQVQLLPFLEQPSDAQIVPVYGCPSDEFGRGTLGQFSYHVNDGLWQIDANGFARADLGRPVRAADITDGLSNTAAFAEKLAWPDIGGMEYPPEALPEYRIRRIRNTADFISNMDAFADECRDNALLPPREWEVIWGYNHILTPNQNSCYNGPRTRPEHTDYWAITATSQHAGGVHALHADGSVRFVAEHVDRWAWRAVGSRNRGEVVAVDW
jgi:prepilin-type processing-associated H-X9-DG protein